MHTFHRGSRRDPRELGDDEIEFLSDQALAKLARVPPLTAEQRNFIYQHVNHPSNVGWTVILGWAREWLDNREFEIVQEASRRPRIAQGSVAKGRGASESQRWKAVMAEFDAAAKADARLARKVRLKATDRLVKGYHRGFPTWAGLAIALGLFALGYFLVGVLRQESLIEECIMQSRHNCSQLLQIGR